MTDQNCLTSACRYCRFYRPEGLHGGVCQQLSVAVRSDWKACQLALPAFANTWENVEDLTQWQVGMPQLISGEELPVTSFELSNVSIGVNN